MVGCAGASMNTILETLVVLESPEVRQEPDGSFTAVVLLKNFERRQNTQVSADWMHDLIFDHMTKLVGSPVTAQ